MTEPKPWVIVVGAGPAGLLLALMLAKKGIQVQVLDSEKTLDNRPRATHYGNPAMYELARAGVADQIREAGFVPEGVCWRKLDGTMLAHLDANVLGDDPNRMACLGLNQVSQIIYKNLIAQPSAEVKWQHKVTGLGQDKDQAWVDVETPEGKQRLEATYVVGCDGANSQIRRSLFGDWEFPGKTWAEQIVATNTYYDFDKKFGWKDSNFIIHPEHWFMAAKISKDGLWRVTYGEKAGLTFDEMRERLPAKFEAMLPGHPKPEEYKLANFSPYKVHQRLAKSMRVGRFLLAADAAHLCNPFGGMGLTGGVVDVGGLYDCLLGIYTGQADESILDKYSEIRREKYEQVVNPISSQNLTRLFETDPDTALEKDEFLKLLVKAEKDEEFSRQFQQGAMILQHDFTQYYHSKPDASPNKALDAGDALKPGQPLPVMSVNG